MQNVFENAMTTLLTPSLGTAEFFVAILVACGLAMIAISSLLPKRTGDDLEWWER